MTFQEFLHLTLKGFLRSLQIFISICNAPIIKARKCQLCRRITNKNQFRVTTIQNWKRADRCSPRAFSRIGKQTFIHGYFVQYGGIASPEKTQHGGNVTTSLADLTIRVSTLLTYTDWLVQSLSLYHDCVEFRREMDDYRWSTSPFSSLHEVLIHIPWVPLPSFSSKAGNQESCARYT